MKGKDILIYGLLIFIVMGMTASSCEESDDDPVFPPLDVGDVTANRLLFTFEESGRPDTRATYEFYEREGTPTITDTIKLRKSSLGSLISYTSSVEFLMDNDTVTDRVEERDQRYIVCYRNFNDSCLRTGNFNLDRDGIVLGTTARWSTLNPNTNTSCGESGFIRVTLDYQPTVKEGLCDAGTRILEATLPYEMSF